MSFAAALAHLTESSVGAGLQAFASDIDAAWVQLALERGGSAELHKRKLPAESVVWLVVGMALFRDHSIADVVRRLDLVVSAPDGSKGRVVGGSLPKARARVGEAPSRELFRLCSRAWAHEHAAKDLWRDLSVYAIDGTTLTLPDTDDNREAFHLPGTGRGQSGYPKARLVALIGARSHLIVDAEFGPCSGKGKGETSLARPLWARLPEHSLLLADRNFLNFSQLCQINSAGGDRHWLL